MKKVLQINKGKYWLRANRQDLKEMASSFDSPFPDTSIRTMVNYIMAFQMGEGDLRFDQEDKCRSYTPYTMTSDYFENVERDAEEQGLLSL